MSVSVVFMGTPQFAVPILQALIDDEAYDVKAVVTQPDRRVGRKHELRATPVKELAVKYAIEVLQPEKLSGSPEMQRVIDLAPDFEITAAFGQFLPVKMLEAAKIAAINVHGSLLPKYRGADSILNHQWRSRNRRHDHVHGQSNGCRRYYCAKGNSDYQTG
mgnify:CR=1 FL=1